MAKMINGKQNTVPSKTNHTPSHFLTLQPQNSVKYTCTFCDRVCSCEVEGK